MRLFVLVLLAALLPVWSPGYAQTAREVTVVKAKLGKLSATRETSVVIGPEQEVTVTAETAGQVLAVTKRQDTTVEAGEVVVQLDTETLTRAVQDAQFALSSAQVNLESARATTTSQQTQAELAVRAAEASYETAQTDYLEAQDLFEIGALAKTELDTAETAFLAAETALGQARATLAQATDAGSVELLQLQVEQAQTNLTQAQDALSQANIAAPVTGVITRMLVEQGTFLGEGAPVFSVASTEQQVATFQVPLPIAEQFSAAGTVKFSYAGNAYTAQVLTASALNPTTQLVTVTARLQPSQNPIPNGGRAQLSYRYADAGGIILPSEAVQRNPGRRFVFTFEEGAAVRREIEIVGEIGDQVAVLGIPEGSRVIYPVPPNLRAGMRVTVPKEQ